jgi:hypothetical protein
MLQGSLCGVMSEGAYPHRIGEYRVTSPLLPKSPVVRLVFIFCQSYIDSLAWIVTTSVRKAKMIDAKEAAENAAADKQARSVEADTFRGVHLDPNAHHWDEASDLVD